MITPSEALTNLALVMAEQHREKAITEYELQKAQHENEQLKQTLAEATNPDKKEGD